MKSTALRRRFIPACAGNARAFPLEVVLRFIPACAGNAPSRSEDGAQAVHPRVCGERRTCGEPRSRRCRFIPACAGNAARSASRLRWPRGSSPRVRGTLRQRCLAKCLGPVHPRVCGERAMRRDFEMIEPVHPRVCGERTCGSRAAAAITGSSPRVRGTLNDDRVSPRTSPVHPRVCGERPSFGIVHRTSLPVHPRVCGERAPSIVCTASIVGSSPRVRGTRPLHPGRSQTDSGSSPRVRGTPVDELLVLVVQPVHPRVCGERFAGASRAQL